MKQYGINIVDMSELLPAQAVILAVGHQLYREWTLDDWKHLLINNGILVDINSTAPAKKLVASGYHVWNL